jgi:hypothetical protein
LYGNLTLQLRDYFSPTAERAFERLLFGVTGELRILLIERTCVCRANFQRDSMFEREQDLVADFVASLETPDSPWGDVTYALEFFYHRGRTDVIAINEEGSLIAFEAKLSRWREAVQQAYRNTCFAHQSYVLLPRRTAQIASAFTDEFRSRRVGLCYVEGGRVTILHEAPVLVPIQPWLSNQAATTILAEPTHECCPS